VVLDDQILPASASLSETLFRMFKRNGADRLVFRQGLEVSEIREVLDVLAESDIDPRVRLRRSPHVDFGDVRGEPAERGAAGGELQVAARRLASVFDSVCGEQRLDTELLNEIVSAVSRAVAEGSRGVLPLAPLARQDEYTLVHAINVAVLSTALAEAMDLDARPVRDLTVSSLLHDVGRRLVPAEILGKRERLTASEIAVVQRHPSDGARLLFRTPGVPEIAPIVAFEHHIRTDGSGYPRVPRGWELSLASRVVQIADVFDALRTHRPYQEAFPVPKIFEIMRGDVGVSFDGELLDLFLSQVVSRELPEPAAALARS
jgi:HD-GYP domain-containing protein (c-di-GMP phosphodiesterase class II)